MSSKLTPAQLAVLERLRVKNEAIARKNLKRKLKAGSSLEESNEPLVTRTVSRSSIDGDVFTRNSGAGLRKSTRGASQQPVAEVPEFEPASKPLAVTAKAPRGRRKTMAAVPSHVKSSPVSAGSALDEGGNRGILKRKIEQSDHSQDSKPASIRKSPELTEVMTPAQLTVLQRIKEKQQTSGKGRKSLKPDSPTLEVVIEPSSKKVRPMDKEDLIKDTTKLGTALTGRASSSSARSAKAITEHDSEEEQPAEEIITRQKKSFSCHSSLKPGTSTTGSGMTPAQLSVLQRIKEKQEASGNGRKSVKLDSLSPIVAIESLGSKIQSINDGKPVRGRPKSGAVLTSRASSTTRPVTASTESDSEEELSTGAVSTRQRKSFSRLAGIEAGTSTAGSRLVGDQHQQTRPTCPVPNTPAVRSPQARLESEGSTSWVSKSSSSSLRTKDTEVHIGGLQSGTQERSSHIVIEDDAYETADSDATDEIVVLTKKTVSPRKVSKVEPHDRAKSGERVQARDKVEAQKKTYLIFDTNAYLGIFPYCKAVLECDKVKDDDDFEDIVMFALFVVVRELDFISKKATHIQKAAMSTIRLIHGALEDKSPRIEGQDFSSSKETLAGSNVNDDFIIKSAELLMKRGDNVLIVTDDNNLQLKLTMMRLPVVNQTDFMNRFHWLTRLVIANLPSDKKFLGDENIAFFAEKVIVSIVHKAIIASLAPMAIEDRRALFPSKRLDTTLGLLLKNKRVFDDRSGPFAKLNFDRVATTLDCLKKFHDGQKTLDCLKLFARFLASATMLCRSLAAFYPNMLSRAELVAAIRDAYLFCLPQGEQEAVQNQSSTETESDRQRQQSSAFKAGASSTQSRGFLNSQLFTSIFRGKDAHPASPASVGSTLRPIDPKPQTKNTPIDSPLKTARASSATRASFSTKDHLISSSVRDRSNENFDKEREQVDFSFSRGRSADLECGKKADLHREPPLTPYKFNTTESYTANRSSMTSTTTRTTARASTTTVSSDTPLFSGLSRNENNSQSESADPYQGCRELISEDVYASVYEYFQRFGMAVCNYTGSCCVKTGVRFSLGFKASGARLETSLHSITDAFSLVVQSMKKLLKVATTNDSALNGCRSPENAELARTFLSQVDEVANLIKEADPVLVAQPLPKITADNLLGFLSYPSGKSDIVAGYKQFADFGNCLEKCWLEVQTKH